MSKFNFETVFDIVRQIPNGRITTYGIIAQLLGIKSGARLIGYALNHAHEHENVPAHRVVNRLGQLSGQHHFKGPLSMQELLEQEGHVIKDNTIQNFQQVLWDPAKEDDFTL